MIYKSAKNIFIRFKQNMARSDFYLISKTTGTLFARYKGKAQHLSDEFPHTVDEIIIGRHGAPGQRVVTTFRDAKGKIIERSFDYPRKPLRNMVYTQSDYVIGGDEYVTSTTRKEYSLARSFLKIYNKIQQRQGKNKAKTLLWSHNKIETNHVSENINTGEKVLSKTSIINMMDLNKQIHRFIEYPHVLGNKIQKGITKLLYFEVDNTSGKVIQNSIFSDGIKLHKNDPYLQFRAYDIDGVKEPVTRKFMRDRRVDKLDVIIDTKYVPQDDVRKTRLIACFFPTEGSISFNKLYKQKSKTDVVGTARHEVEHIWQYWLDARNGEYEAGTWQSDMYQKFGPIRSKNLQREADKCTDSIDNYVEFTEDFQAYLKNYIEAEAHREERIAKEKYDRQGERLRQSLSHIPKELL